MSCRAWPCLRSLRLHESAVFSANLDPGSCGAVAQVRLDATPHLQDIQAATGMLIAHAGRDPRLE